MRPAFWCWHHFRAPDHSANYRPGPGWESLIESGPDTETATKVFADYEKLKKNGFQLPDGYENRKLAYPSFVE
ncbi:hypothetical protein [Peribacillus glennii]|uniref:hypothetical protein n=1 Tax=Peribacillus glennii TaxID=2303991 RepID=UPI00115D774D|nr:hypothetical protein [Peribacillus glennii]